MQRVTGSAMERDTVTSLSGQSKSGEQEFKRGSCQLPHLHKARNISYNTYY
uniref:Uncharacterized protein n=1 Tax=Setaria viridis TaxID=4556 RepID=A0A4U6UJL7_SETVI|nr:hypothetical protein SEVIR_6G187901v2 [Setaria viridis]